MQENKKISNKQIRALMVSTIIGIGILTLPNVIVLELGNDGWIGIILGGLLMLPSIIAINKIFQLYPDRDFFEIGKIVLGKWILNIFLILSLVYLIASMSLISRNLGEITKAFLLETTPIEVIIISFILTTSYIARSEIEIISRAAYHIYPIILGFIIFLIIVTLPDIDLSNALPAFQLDIGKLPKAIMISFFSYLGFEILLFSIPYVEDKRKTLKSSLVGIGLVIFINVLIFFITLSQYGSHYLGRQIFPTLSVIKEVDLPGLFIENLDGLAMAFWVLIVFASMAPIYYITGKILSKIISTKDHSLFILPLLPIIYILSLMPQNIIQVSSSLGNIINYSGFVSVVIMPIIIYIVGYLKTRKEEKK